jgi:arylesterase/paraoxonase
MSPDGGKLYLSETLGNRLRIYERQPASGDVVHVDDLEISGAPDNLNVDASGIVWIAAHAKTLALVRHFMNAANRAPTLVLRFDPAARGAARLQQIYADAGEQFSAGSVAAVHQQQLLVGSITERGLLRCRLR